MPSRITCTASAVERSRSVSSTRSRNLPPVWRAYSQLKSAVRTPPTCSMPVGLGANRVTTVIGSIPAAIRGRECYQGRPLHAPSPRIWLATAHCGADLPWPRVVYRLPVPQSGAVSSAVEHCFHTAGATGSIPVPPTIQNNSLERILELVYLEFVTIFHSR